MQQEGIKQRVIIVGAGPLGLSATACLPVEEIFLHRLHLHLRKQYCQLRKNGGAGGGVPWEVSGGGHWGNERMTLLCRSWKG
ncbi:hypothetical protein JHK82_054240 [Glycine max]|nr:hypothetical protein JHK87_054146 [Glycine soja]KAG5086843.1 hypothetical protein JHK82_054240 [Glycine max]KHN43555.1 hypothetical protein glysoja_002138 [Glycine soja]